MSHSMQRLQAGPALENKVERQISKIIPCMHLTTGTYGHAHAVYLCSDQQDYTLHAVHNSNRNTWAYTCSALMLWYTYIKIHLRYCAFTVHLQCCVANMQGLLVHNMRYLASVVSNCFTAFGELLALNKRFAELSGGVTRYPTLTLTTHCIVCCNAKLAACLCPGHLLCGAAKAYQWPRPFFSSAVCLTAMKSIALAVWPGLYTGSTAMQVQVRCYL